MWQTAVVVGILLSERVATVSSDESRIVVDPPQSVVAVPLDPVLTIAAQCQTGTLIFSRGDCLAVRIYTGSGYTHVAAVVREGKTIDVYDSMNGTGVRKLSLADYLATQRPDEVQLFHPRRPLTEEETTRFRAYLDSQIGRPYSVKHHLTGRKSKGIHCSEYATEALIAIDWLKAENPVKVSPASLARGIESDGVHTAGDWIHLPFEAEPVPEPQGCCARWWERTKSCTMACCRQMSRSLFCR